MTRLPSRNTRASALAFAVIVAVLVSACGGSTPASTARPSATPSAPPPAASDTPAPALTPTPTAPVSTPVPTASAAPGTPSASPTEVPADSSPTPTITPGAADACTGSDDNREFLAHVAAAVEWPVYCAVLPGGWFVDTGSYRLANGGKLIVTFRGPGGATVALSEGAFCPDTSGCVPAGSDQGDAAFGDRTGTLVALDDGGWAIVVDRDAALSWLLVTTGINEAGTRAIGAALAPVEG